MSVLDTNILINYYFEKICKIPHGSYNEEKIADYVVEIAKKYNRQYYRDHMNNVIVYKDASKGYEDHETILLGAHLDMVCEKNKDSDHDFENDPLDLYIEDGYLHARGTTLGADDGYGVCYMLAILSDDTLKHPPLECVFTVQEEVGLIGAMEIDETKLNATRMIGLDSETEGEVTTSSSGGNEVKIYRDYELINNNDPVYVFEIKGLLGGHSGRCIDMARGNANKLAARLLFHLLKNNIDVRLVDITGGLKDNAIPRECVVTFASSSDEAEIDKVFNQVSDDIKAELQNSDAGVTTVMSTATSDTCISNEISRDIIMTMYLCINGLIEKSQVIAGLTTISLNMGVVRFEDNRAMIHYALRSPLLSVRNEMVNQLESVAHIFNGYVDVFSDYPGWDYDASSALRKQLKEFYFNRTGSEMKEYATHGGLETGVFKGKIPELDIVTFGPNMSDIHTPDERLDIQSYLSTYDFLIDFLETL